MVDSSHWLSSSVLRQARAMLWSLSLPALSLVLSCRSSDETTGIRVPTVMILRSTSSEAVAGTKKLRCWIPLRWKTSRLGRKATSHSPSARYVLGMAFEHRAEQVGSGHGRRDSHSGVEGDAPRRVADE